MLSRGGNAIDASLAAAIALVVVEPASNQLDLSRHLQDVDLVPFGVSRADPHGHIPAGQGVEDGGILNTIAQAAATSVWCATSPQLVGTGGVYCEDLDIAVVSDADDPGAPGVKSWAIDPDAATRLWSTSEDLTGVRLGARAAAGLGSE